MSATAASAAASIEGRGIVKTFGGFTAVDGLTLDIRSGEFVSLIGPSGCGKSTFMLMAAGLIPTSGGELLVNGKTLTEPLTDIGIVFQDHLLLEFRTALENVMLQAEIRGLPLAPARDGRSSSSPSSASAMPPIAIPSSSPAACANASRSRAR